MRPGDEATLIVFPGAPIDVEFDGAPPGATVDVESWFRKDDGRWESGADRPSTQKSTTRLHVGRLDVACFLRARTRDRAFVAIADGVKPGATVRLSLAHALRITGRVSAPADAERVTVSYSQVGGPISDGVRVDDHGDYVLDGLPPGRFELLAWTGNLRTRGTVEAGGTLDLVLR